MNQKNNFKIDNNYDELGSSVPIIENSYQMLEFDTLFFPLILQYMNQFHLIFMYLLSTELSFVSL